MFTDFLIFYSSNALKQNPFVLTPQMAHCTIPRKEFAEGGSLTQCHDLHHNLNVKIWIEPVPVECEAGD
jgi:hypothetical protein